MFFYNGEIFRCDLICCFIQKLNTVLDVMEKELCSYRFYNSSLLLVYEGEWYARKKDCFMNEDHSAHVSFEQCTCECTAEQMDIRMIDFAHVSRDDTCTDDTSCSTSPDKGYILGLKSLIRLLHQIQEDHHRRKNFHFVDLKGNSEQLDS